MKVIAIYSYIYVEEIVKVFIIFFIFALYLGAS